MTTMTEETRTDTYNGWTNRETWAIAMHVNNDQGMQEWAHERVRAAIAETRDPRDETLRVEDALREWVEEITDPSEQLMEIGAIVTLLKDVGSLWRVNWRELGESFISDVREADES